ncbi:glycosyltransferase family 4 protein [Brevundimonas sp.]|jgi:glycosyltransferase involved in cell wall biosynthesis|uniref:glycosyltransferase family 4 protein n=1 Tax=Brevundimonas sp. TaxID=1871086 RepID=UPI00391C6AF8
MASICIDGFNIALPNGSGIATFGRNLLTNARAAGYGTQVLYGPRHGRSKNPILNEVALTDAGEGPKGSRLRRFYRQFREPMGRTLHPVTPTGEVIWPRAGGGMPAADYFWTSQALFSDANTRFRARRRFTEVRFGDGATAPDLMHWTTVLPLRARGVPNVCTIHDLIPLRLPHTTLDNKRAFLALCRRIAREADHVTVVSEATRQDVIRLLKMPEERVTNTYQAVRVPEAVTRRSDEEVAREIEGLFQLGWKEYYLYFGAVEPKKNLGRIVQAYLASGVKTPLVVIGGRAWLAEAETALLNQMRERSGSMAERLLQFDYLPYPMLMSLARGARATLFPSLYEGFGLPVLESMLLGTAVLTSTGGSLPEVAGEAAHIVDPYDVEAISQGIRALDMDEDYRTALEAAGRLQAARFSPEAYQARLKAVYGRFGL